MIKYLYLQQNREGKLCIIQDVGYPNPNRSHFRSIEIWETGSDSDEYLQTGWLGRYFDNKCDGAPPIDEPVGIHISNQLPSHFIRSRLITYMISVYRGIIDANQLIKIDWKS